MFLIFSTLLFVSILFFCVKGFHINKKGFFLLGTWRDLSFSAKSLKMKLEEQTGLIGRRDFASLFVLTASFAQWTPHVSAKGWFDGERPIPFNPDAEVRPLDPYVGLLPQSALLYLLPSNNKPLRQIQKQVERANALRASYILDADYTAISGEVWENIAQACQACLATLDGFRSQLEPAFSADAPAEVQVLRNEIFAARYDKLKQLLQDIESAAGSKNITELLTAQEDALLTLGDIGEATLSNFPYEISAKKQYDTVPRLFGRAKVELVFERPTGEDEELQIVGNITIIADGFSAPITAGNFVDLCQRGFYNELPLIENNIMTDKGTLNVTVGGTYRNGFIDPITGQLRRVPLEILRYNIATQKQTPRYGSANSRVVTKDPIVQSFRISGAVGMYHPDGDRNGGSSQFFFLPPELHRSKTVDQLNENYSIFGYIVAGKDFISELKPGDQIKSAVVTEGLENLRKIKPSFWKTLVDTFKEE